jgi:hypothetical protein
MIACAAFEWGSHCSAGALDGQWHLGMGHFQINVQTIRTPGGNKIPGIATARGGLSDAGCRVLSNEVTIPFTPRGRRHRALKECNPLI